MASRAIWITRAQPGADATAERVRALGFEPVIAPLLATRRLPDVRLDLEGVAALAFTSANAVATFAALSLGRTLPVFAVGDATAAAARAQGFAEVASAEGDVAALATLIAARRRGLTGLIFYAAPAEPARDLAALLAVEGVEVRQATLYETVLVDPGPALDARLADLQDVLLHSGRAAEGLASHLARQPAPHLRAWCLSPAIAARLDGVQVAAVTAAARPEEVALLALLGPADRA